jgi:hypothetical protein
MAIGITECPHCHRRVIPSAGGECPSCSKNVTDPVATASGLRLLVVRPGMTFPMICFHCGQPARRHVDAQVSNVDSAVSMKRWLWRQSIPFGGLFAAFEAAKHDLTVRIRLPICDVCRKLKVQPEIQSYDLEDREIRLVVHENFRDLAMQS